MRLNKLITGLILLMTVVGCQRIQDRGVIREGKKNVIARGEKILFIAHPTAKYVDTKFEGYERLENAKYLLTFDIEYKGLLLNKNNNFLKLLVTVNDKGELLDYKWGRDTGLVPPGAVNGALGSLLMEALSRSKK